MTRARFTQKGRAGRFFVFGGNRFQNMADLIPGVLRTAAHDGRTEARAFLATGNTDPHEARAFFGSFRRAAVRVVVIGIARIDDEIACIEQRPQSLDLCIDRFTGRNHQDHRARGLDGCNEVFQRLGRNQFRREFPGLRHELVGLLRGPVEHRDLKAMFGNIERKVATHGTETDQADFRGRAV